MLCFVLLAQTVLAEEPGVPVDEKPVASSAVTPTADRSYLMEVNFRSRWMTVPDSLLDIWFYNDQDNNGIHPERPHIRALALGLEYVIRQDSANGIFYLEYLHSLMKEGYWDDVEDPPNFQDGDYLRPDGLGMITLGGNYAFALPINPGDPNVEVAFMAGGGLGLGILLGEVQTWDGYVNPDTGQYTSAYELILEDPSREPDETLRIPKVLPMVDINAGFRFVIAQKATIRLEGGLHDMLYMGGSAGIVF